MSNRSYREQEEELADRTKELLEENSNNVLVMLTQYAQSSGRFLLPLLDTDRH